MGTGIQLTVGDIIYGVVKRWKLIVIMTFVGLIIGAILTGMTYLQGSMTRNYEINTSIVINARGKSGNYSTGKEEPEKNDFQMSIDMADTVRYILKSEGTMSRVIEKMDLIGVTPKNISSNLRVNRYNETPVLEFTLIWRSAEEGTKIVETLLDVANTTMRDTLGTGSANVITAPTARYIVGGSLNAPLWGIVAALGLLGGIGLSSLDILLRPTLINMKDVQTEFHLETVGVIPKDDDYFKNNKKSISTVLQDYSAAAYIVRNRMSTVEGCKKIYVTSAIRGEGRTSVAIHLAKQISEMEKKVLLVDFDTQNPEVGIRLLGGVDFEKSLNALYRGDISEKEAVSTINGYLDVLPVVLEHTPVPIDSMVLGLVEKLSSQYDYVIIDAPPAGQVSDALSINQIADAALVVIGFDMAQKMEITECIDRLEKSGVRILGCIVNQERSLESLNLFGKDEGEKKKTRKTTSRQEKDTTLSEMTLQQNSEKKNVEKSEEAGGAKQKRKRKRKKENKEPVTDSTPEETSEKLDIMKTPVQHDLMGEMFSAEQTMTDDEMLEQLLSGGSH